MEESVEPQRCLGHPRIEAVPDVERCRAQSEPEQQIRPLLRELAPGQRELRQQLLALTRGAEALRKAVPAAVGKEAGVADDDGACCARVLARPAQADQPAPVMDDENRALDSHFRAESLQRLDMALPRSRQVGRRGAEAGEIRRDRAVPGRGEGGEEARPHIGALRKAVDQEDGVALRRAGRRGLAVGDRACSPGLDRAHAGQPSRGGAIRSRKPGTFQA